MSRHDIDAVSVAFGVTFLAFVGWWLLTRWIDFTAPSFGWFVGAAFIALGALGAFAALRSVQRHAPR